MVNSSEGLQYEEAAIGWFDAVIRPDRRVGPRCKGTHK